MPDGPEKTRIEEAVKVVARQQKENPLWYWEGHAGQMDFLTAESRLIAAFAGNRFGKTTALTVAALRELCVKDSLPEWMKGHKRFDPPVFGRIVVPDYQTLEAVVKPSFRKWAPKHELYGGTFDKAWEKSLSMLRFKNESWIDFKTYRQDLDQFGGAPLHFVGFDEPPPYDIFRECEMRTADFGGFLMFAMTPLMGIGWVYRDIWKRQDDPDITVVKGSIHENPHLNKDAVKAILGRYDEDDPERLSREYGDFAHFGGMVYTSGFERVLVDPPEPSYVQSLQNYVGIDPGLRNAAFVWGGFDQDNVLVIYDEVLLQDKTPKDYAEAIRAKNAQWGIDPLYVIDPSARNRSLTNAESVEAELARCGIYCQHGQNAVEAGVQQIRRRMQGKHMYVSKACRGLREEAEEYRIEDRPDGEFKVVKERDHRLDATRYLAMAHPWWPPPIDEKKPPPLGVFEVGPYKPPSPDVGPLGAYA